MITNRRGSLVLEATMSVSAILLVLGGISLLTYLWFGKAMLDQTLHDSLICIAEGRGQGQCLREARSKARVVGGVPGKTTINLNPRRGKWHGDIRWQAAPHLALKIHKELTVTPPPGAVPPSLSR